mmetsp:Transcript_143280/g.399431  ORF Transcript_143280/g.399431 Transcript_143280/m.399431 type:complete len:236 (-) Transcript_143280:318-1025(-)
MAPRPTKMGATTFAGQRALPVRSSIAVCTCRWKISKTLSTVSGRRTMYSSIFWAVMRCLQIRWDISSETCCCLFKNTPWTLTYPLHTMCGSTGRKISVMPSQFVKYPMTKPDTGKITNPAQHLKLCLVPWSLQSNSPPPFSISQSSICRTPRRKPMTAATCWMKVNSRESLKIWMRSTLLSTSTSMAICLMSMIRFTLAFRSAMTGWNMTWHSSRIFLLSSSFTQSGSVAHRSGQ